MERKTLWTDGWQLKVAGDREGEGLAGGSRKRGGRAARGAASTVSRRLTSAAAGTRPAIDGRARPCVIGRGRCRSGTRANQVAAKGHLWMPLLHGLWDDSRATLEPGADTWQAVSQPGIRHASVA